MPRFLPYLISISLFTASFTSFSQSPGGVASDLQLWYKADQGAESDGSGTAATNLDPVQIWQDQSGNNFDADQSATAGSRPTFTGNLINGNPALVFDGANDFFPISTLNYATAGSLTGLTFYTVLSTTNTGEGNIISFDRSEYFRFATNHNNQGGFGLGTAANGGAIDDFNATGTIEIDGIPHILGASVNTSTVGINKFAYFDGTINNSKDAGSTAIGTGTTRFGFIGTGSEATAFNGDTGPNNYLEGDFSEFIFYEQELSEADRQRVETYLALKYGITLSTDTDGDAVTLETGTIDEGDYVTSGGATVWDASANSAYHFQIAGVGRDDNSGLLQTTSQSVNSNSVLSITETSFNDQEFVVLGNNNVGLTSSTSASSFERQLNRIWKIQNNGTDVSNIDQITLDVSDILVLPDNIADIALLIDSDEDFSDATVLTPDLFTSNTITFNNVDLTGVTFFTLAFNLPAPAGVSSNLTFWFKADDGAREAFGNPADDSDQIRFWRDQSGNGFDGQQDNNAERPVFNNSTSQINFNPVITFDGATHMSINDLNYDITTNTLDEITIFSVVKSTQSSEGIVVSYDRSSFYRLALNHTNNPNFGLSTTVEGSTDVIDDNNANTSASDGLAHIIGGDYSTATDQKRLFIDGDTDNTFVAAHGATGGNLGLSTEVPRYGFIAANSEANDPTDGGSGDGIVGDIAEIIYFEGILSSAELAQVQSYLGIKYGITLADDYIAGDGTTVVWDNSANIGYNELIAGIALDATSDLDQPQSRSESLGSILAGSDAGLNDGDYVLWGSDNGDLSTVTGTTGPQDSRFNRIWKYQVEGTTTMLDQLTFDLSETVIKPTSLSNYSLVIDDADDFGTPVRVITPTSLTDGVLQFDNVDLTSASFFTVAVSPDLDNDGVADATDLDDDNDGILDTDELAAANDDPDGDGITNDRDLDSDNDGIGDLYEAAAGTTLSSLDTNDDGILDGAVGANGLHNSIETDDTGGAAVTYTISNSDGQGPLDYLDLDSDDNGISDLVESGRSTGLDTDDDGLFEGTDTDLDGVPDVIDPELSVFGSTSLLPIDQDGTGEPDFRDLDNDDDGTNDIIEVGLGDADGNMDGRLDGTTDADNDGVFDDSFTVSGSPLLRDNDAAVFGEIDLATLLTGGGTDWYSYRSGNWDEPDNWTLDPSGTTRINPGGLIPENLVDNVTILNGDEITLNFDGLVVSSVVVEEGGILNVGTTVNHNFNVISGAGVIRLASDEFPSGVTTDFAAITGGTVVYRDQSPAVDYELTVARTFNNVVFNSTANTITLKADLTLNGSLTVESGTLQINDNTGDSYTDNTTPLSILVNEDITIDDGANITTGNVDASIEIGSSGVFNFHEIELLGNFTNNGTVNFTNFGPTTISDGRYRDKYPTASDVDNNTGTNQIPMAEFGAVEVLFTNGLADQLITLNGPSDFYRVEIAKGTSQTFIAEFNASAQANFRLLGRIAMNMSDDSGDTPNIANHRALGLEAGILKLGTNIVIDQIAKNDPNGSAPTTQGGNRNYIIDLDAQLWISENAQVTKSNDWGIHPFGKLKVSDDGLLTFTGTGQRTILVDNQGVFEMTGGTVDITQYRNKTGADGPPRGSFIMTGGTMNVGNGAVDGNHAIFSVPWAEQSFVLNASDDANPPTINIILDGNRGKDNAAVQIGAADGNFDVGVSNLNIIHTSNTDYKISSTAPLYNLSYNNSGTGELIITEIEDSNDDPPVSGVQPDDNTGATPSPSQVGLPLTIENDFTITDGRFDANDFDITIGNLFTIVSGGEYDAGNNTTLFNGTSAVQRIILNGADPLLGGFNNLSFTGTGTTKEEIGDLTAFTILGDLSIGAGVTFDDGGKTITVNGNIENSGIHETDFAAPGSIILSGGAAQHTIGGDGNGRFEILTLNDPLGATFSAAQQIDSVLNLVDGILDINTNQLTINSTAANPIIDNNPGDGATNNFDATRMIQTSGNASDGGLNYYFDANVADPGAVLFPVGTDANATVRYTPGLVDLSAITDDGFVRMRMADEELQTVDVTALASNLLTYYWRVSNTGFDTAPTVDSYVFSAVDSDDPDAGATPTGLPVNFVPGKVLDESPFTRSQENTSNIANLDITFNGNGSGFTLQDANYTAGDGTTTLFTGSPEIYYNNIAGGSSNQAWDAASSWFTDEARTIAAADFPRAGDIAVVGGNNFNEGVTISGTQEAAEVIFDRTGTYVDLEDLPRLRFSPTDQLTVSKVSGVGDIYLQRNLSNNATLNADIGDFAANDTSLVQVYLTQNGSYTINDGDFFTEFPSLRIYGQLAGYQRDVTFAYDFTAKRLLVDGQGTLIVGGNYTIEGETDLGFTSYGRIQFPNGTEAFTFVTDSIRTANNKNTSDTNLQAIEVIPGNANAVDHRLVVNSNIILDFFDTENVGVDNVNIDLYNSDTENNVILEFTGEGVHSFSNDFSPGQYNIELYRVVVNKGASQTNVVSLDTDLTINGSSNGVTKPIVLQNGTLVLNDPGIDVTVSSGIGEADFVIPATSALEVRSGTVRITKTGVGDGNGLRLNGRLAVTGGDVILDGGPTADNYIQYGSAGAAELEITDGNLVVGSQLRRNILTGDGVIEYTQTGGTAIFGANVAPESSRGVFEILNSGTPGSSSFKLSGASSVFALVHAQDAPLSGTFIIGDDVNVSVSADAIIDFGFNGTVASSTYQNDLNERYLVSSSAALPNIRVDDDNNNSPIVEMIERDLTVTNNLEILNGGSFLAGGFDLTINNGFTNNGTYTPGSNTTIFNGASQVVDGTTATTFNNLRVNPSTSLTLANSITVNGNLDVQTGMLDDNGNRITLLGNLSLTTSIESDGTGNGGVSFDGVSAQTMTLPDGDATIDKLIINNPNGIAQNENSGVATVLTINDELALDNGLIELGDNRIIFDPDAVATSSTGFDETKMISVNGVKRSDGVERQFLANTNVVPFEIPVGTPDKYTPVTLDVDDSDDPGSILVKPINAVHPSANAALTGPTDELDALNYYWLVTTDPSSVTGFQGSISFQYLEDDANNPGQNESTWEDKAARLIAPNWFKPSGNLVDITNNIMTFTNSDLSSFGGTTFDGEFTIGNDIPDELAQYRSNQDGLWNVGSNWDIENDGDGLFDDGNGVPQPGTVVIIDSDDEITMSSSTDDDQNIFSLLIDEDGILDVADSDGHNFGDISGTGTLRISNPTLPGGNYDAFFLTTGGALDLSGTGGYTISPDFASGVRGLTVSGGGTKVLPAIAINVGVEGINLLENASLNNPNNNTMITSGDVNVNTTGSFALGSAVASLSAVNFNMTAGTFTTSGAAMDLSGNLAINGGTFTAGSATHTVAGNFNLSGAATFNRGAGRITFDGTGDQTITGTAINFHNLRVDKTGGTMTLAAGSSALINNSLGLFNGNILGIGSGSQLRLVGTARYTTGSDGYVDGPLFKDLADDVTTPFVFRIGEGTNYKPITIDPLNGSYVGDITWEAEYYQANPTTFSSPENSIEDLNSIEINAVSAEQVEVISSSEFWRLDDGGGGGELDVITLSINGTNSGVSAADLNDEFLQVMVWDEINSEWDHLGGDSEGTDPSSAAVRSTEVLSFTEKIVTLGAESNTSLPVELLNFDAVIQDNVTTLTWETATELNNDYFEIQHSFDNVTYETVGTVKGNGTTNQVMSYTFIHNDPFLGANYYRLRQVDFDGKSEVHETILRFNDLVRAGIEAFVYPNPATSSDLKIRLVSGDNNTVVRVKIVNITGQVFFEKQYTGALYLDEKVEIDQEMSSGIYFVEVQQGANLERQKLIIK
ncbi:MAG: T9SS type A sorting domain-containing protein [Bacteroidota bacterium]